MSSDHILPENHSKIERKASSLANFLWKKIISWSSSVVLNSSGFILWKMNMTIFFKVLLFLSKRKSSTSDPERAELRRTWLELGVKGSQNEVEQQLSSRKITQKLKSCSVIVEKEKPQYEPFLSNINRNQQNLQHTELKPQEKQSLLTASSFPPSGPSVQDSMILLKKDSEDVIGGLFAEKKQEKCSRCLQSLDLIISLNDKNQELERKLKTYIDLCQQQKKQIKKLEEKENRQKRQQQQMCPKLSEIVKKWSQHFGQQIVKKVETKLVCQCSSRPLQQRYFESFTNSPMQSQNPSVSIQRHSSQRQEQQSQFKDRQESSMKLIVIRESISHDSSLSQTYNHYELQVQMLRQLEQLDQQYEEEINKTR